MSGVSRSPYDAAVEHEPQERSGLIQDIGWILGYFLAAGFVAGLVWWQVVDPPYFMRTSQGGVMDQAQLSHRVRADGWFMAIGGVAGLLGGIGLTRWRDGRPVLVLLVGVVASVAAGGLALELGRLLGHRDVSALLKSATVGAHISDKLDVISPMVLAAWSMGFLVGSVAILLGTRGRHLDVQGSDEPTDDTRVDTHPGG